MLYCSNCGSPVENGNIFCTTCGTNLSSIPDESIPTPAIYQEAVQNTSKPVKKNMVLFVVIGILGAALIGLGVFFFIESGNLKTDISNLESDVTSLETDLADRQNNINSLQTQLVDEKAKVANLQGQLADTTSQLNASQAEVTNLEGELADAMANVASLESELEAALSQIESLQSQLTAIQAKYPLKDFPDYKALSNWLSENVCQYTDTFEEWYSNALKMQLLAAQDGYYISACLVHGSMTANGYPMVYNTALVNDTLYLFDPEDTELYSMGEWRR